jgi:uncharacterized protein (TIGR02217 family)
MAVDEIIYPLSLDRIMSSPEGNTTIIELGNGDEIRVANWDDLRLRVNASHGVRSLADLQLLHSFFRRRKSQTRPFLVRDMGDFTISPDNPINPGEAVFGTGDGAETIFQLKKNYVDAFNTDTRTIRKPQDGTVTIYVDGLPEDHLTIDYSTGLATFDTAPGDGAILEWEGWFYVPVRFAVDALPLSEFGGLLVRHASGEWIVDRAAGEIPDIPMIEVLNET